MPALSLVLVTEAQMFVVGGSEIDLGSARSPVSSAF